MASRLAVRARGVVQGVGFRPFVHNLAVELGLSGSVRNDAEGVLIYVQGEAVPLGEFMRRLLADAPPLAEIEAIEVSTGQAGPGELNGFHILASGGGGTGGGGTLISPDTATCEECLGELFDPSDRRYGYPFVNCTNCGPRFTIVTSTPYDRPNTTMAAFEMCPACRAEYDDPADRRYHAQPTCCPECGPRLSLVDAAGHPLAGGSDALEDVVQMLWSDKVVAVKGLGGFHLAALASSDLAVGNLRSRKHREDKPFALMVADLVQAGRLCTLSEAEVELLVSPERPIVLAERRAGATCAAAVAPASATLGLMLPYSGLHHLLAGRLGEPFVLTSGNVSDEPIAYTDEDALSRLGGIADAFLLHDRPIHMRTDDSVARIVAGRPVLLRRSRGFVPRPVHMGASSPVPVLGVGAELKSTFCLLEGDRAFVSHHIGDLENYPTLRSFEEGIEHFCRLFEAEPSVVAHDLHPEYLSTKYALGRSGVELVAVQHHHAHVAACLATNGHDGPAIGVAFDGLGMGDDATLWGGEILVADLAGYRRIGRLEHMALPGGPAAVRQPWRMAAAYLDAVYGDDLPAGLALPLRHADQWAPVVSLARMGRSADRSGMVPAAPVASSAGRLFDALGALLCERDVAGYEGQAAIELETLAAAAGIEGAEPYTFAITGSEPFVLPGTGLFASAVTDLLTGAPPAVVARRAHATMASMVVAACERGRVLAGGLDVVAVCGGVFQNALLSRLVLDGLEARGFRVLTSKAVPPNDGGISLGQVAVAAARLRLRR